jgi:ABC-type Na+ transport system ATPase subunit NatA
LSLYRAIGDRLGAFLSSVSFVAEAGKTMALVGRSVGGKPTVMNLILRLYEINSGPILCNGVEAHDKVVRVGGLGGGYDVLVGSSGRAHRNVIADLAFEQEIFLGSIANLLARRLSSHRRDIER